MFFSTSFRWLLLFSFLTPLKLLPVADANAQSKIDVVRASNFYADALNEYKSGDYSKSLERVLKSEEYLRGKSNRDLVYLKIQILTQLNRRTEAYDLIVQYFENPPWSDNLQSYQNIKPWAEELDRTYNEDLTALFVELENSATTQEKVEPSDAGTRLAQRFISHLHELEFRFHDPAPKRLTHTAPNTTHNFEVITSSFYEFNGMNKNNMILNARYEQELTRHCTGWSTVNQTNEIELRFLREAIYLSYGKDGPFTLADNAYITCWRRENRDGTLTQKSRGQGKDAPRIRKILEKAASSAYWEHRRAVGDNHILKNIPKSFPFTEEEKLAFAKAPDAFRAAFYQRLSKEFDKPRQ